MAHCLKVTTSGPSRIITVSHNNLTFLQQKIMTQQGNVDVCPVTKETWEARAEAKKADCGGQSVYHCLADSEGRKWEKCVEKALIKEGFCPIFSRKGFIDWKSCNISAPTCPNSSYVSNEVYKQVKILRMLKVSMLGYSSLLFLPL